MWRISHCPLVPQDEPVDCRKQELSLSEIQQKVKEYNAQVNSNLFMVLVRNTFSVKDVNMVTLYFKVSLLQYNYTFKFWLILINYMYLLYG